MRFKQFVVVPSCGSSSSRNEEKAGKQISYHLSFSYNTKLAALNDEDAQHR